MASSPFISIITVVFNAGNHLENTISSIEKQTLHNFEYIIVDGGSTDNTIEIIKKHSPLIDQWISEKDEGLYDAMNKGLKMASGKFVWFINAGDQLFDSSIIEKVFYQYQQEQSDIYYGGTIVIDLAGNEIGLRRQKLPGKLTWKSLKMGMVVSHQAIIVKRSIAPFYNLGYKYSSDIDWVIASLKATDKITNLQMVICYFLDGGRSKQTIVPSLKERFVIMTNYYGLVKTVVYHFPIAFKFLLFLFRNRRF